ncbi:MAG: hypothetical protein ACI9H8_001727 [Lysobacterales bacterium]|jgi:hypothetical protein
MSDVQSNSSWNQRLFAVLWIWISFRTILPWLVFFRLTFEGDSYSWGTSYFGHMFHSSGLARPDFLVIYALLAVSLFMLWQLRKQNFKLGGALLLLYLGFFALNALYQWMTGEPMIFEGDTLGVKVDLSTPFFLFNFGMFILGQIWWWGIRDLPQGPGPQAMSNHKKLIVKVCIFFVPLQLALLIFGEPHELTDEIGVIGTMLQWFLLAYALYPGSKYR